MGLLGQVVLVLFRGHVEIDFLLGHLAQIGFRAVAAIGQHFADPLSRLPPDGIDHRQQLFLVVLLLRHA